MAEITITIEVKIAWWFTYLYIPGLIVTHYICSILSDVELVPNWDRIDKVIDKALTAKVVRQ